jgi:hypothetical protein
MAWMNGMEKHPFDMKQEVAKNLWWVGWGKVLMIAFECHVI